MRRCPTPIGLSRGFWTAFIAASATACGALLGLSGDDDAPVTSVPSGVDAAPAIDSNADASGFADGGCPTFASGARTAVVRPSSRTKTIDGDLSDFEATSAFVLDACNAAETRGNPQATASVRLEWTANVLYVAIDVADSSREGTDASPPYLNDGVEVYVTADAERNGCYGANDRHFIIDHTGVALRFQVQDPDAAVEPMAADQVKVVPTAGGYRVELAIDAASTFDATLTKGQTLYFNVLLNDNNGEAQANLRIWAKHPFDADGVCGCGSCGGSPAYDTRWLSPIVLE